MQWCSRMTVSGLTLEQVMFLIFSFVLAVMQSAQNKQETEYMSRLSELGVDLTEYLRTKKSDPCNELIVLQG